MPHATCQMLLPTTDDRLLERAAVFRLVLEAFTDIEVKRAPTEDHRFDRMTIRTTDDCDTARAQDFSALLVAVMGWLFPEVTLAPVVSGTSVALNEAVPIVDFSRQGG